jgi:hypothetical protein
MSERASPRRPPKSSAFASRFLSASDAAGSWFLFRLEPPLREIGRESTTP